MNLTFHLHRDVPAPGRSLTLTPLALACALQCAATGLHAQTATDAQLAPVEIRDAVAPPESRLELDTPSTTGSRLGLTPRQTPGSVSIVPRSAIDGRGANDTQEILRGVPGVNYASPPGSAGSISYRGFSGGAITQLFNGITVQYDAIAARPVDSWIYDRVEVIGGASSFLYGAGAVGGSINYITKLPERADLTEAQVRTGSHHTRELSFGLNRAVGGGAGPATNFVRLDVNHRRSDGYVDGNGSRSTQVAASWLAQLTAHLQHTLAYEFQDEDVRRPYWGTPVLNPTVGVLAIDERTRFKNYNSADGIYAQKVQWLRSITEYQVSPALQIRNTAYGYSALRDYRNVEVYRYNAANTQVVRSSPLLQRHDQDLVGNRLEATIKSTLAGRRSDWALGLDLSLNRQTRFPNSLTLNVSTVDPLNFTTERFFDIPGMTPGFVPDRDNAIRTRALYAENRTELQPGWSLVTALRHERVELDLTNRRTVTAANPAAFSRAYSPTTGRVGLVWDIAPGANVYVQYATAADPPSGLLATASFADVRTNSDLTTGRQFEIGSKFDFLDGRGNGSVALYQINRKNLSTPDPTNPNVSILVGEQSARGIELAGAIRATAATSVQANLGWVDARFESFSQVVNGVAVSRAGNVPTNTPRVVANLFAHHRFSPQWEGNLGLRHVGRVWGDVANTFQAPAYTLLDLGATYRPSRQLAWTLRVKNATDKVYAASLTSTPMFYLGAPRTVELGLRATF